MSLAFLLVFLARSPCTTAAQAGPHVPASPPAAAHGLALRTPTLPWTGPPSLQDVPYAPFTPRTVFDWYAPPHSLVGQSAAPVIVYVHGSGFEELGDETLDVTQAPWVGLRARGYAIVAVRWRQRPSGVFDTAMADDPAHVVQLLRANAAAWHVDPSAIVGYGVSSGAFALGLLAFGPERAVRTSTDPVARESSRITAFVNDRCESDWRHFVDTAVTHHPFAATSFAAVPAIERERASALWWLEQPGAPTVPTISFSRSPVHAPPLVNLHDGWLGWELTNRLHALGEAHCSFALYPAATPLPWPSVCAWLYAVVGW